MHPMRGTVRTHVLEPATGLVHITVSHDENDQAFLAKDAGRGKLMGYRTPCTRLNGMWVPRDRAVTCFECLQDEALLDPRFVR